MLSLLRTVSIPYFRQHWVRVALIVASIAVGVAALVATRTLNKTMTSAVGESVTPLAAVADLLVTKDQWVKQELVEDLVDADIPGIETIQPLTLGRVTLLDFDNRTGLLLGVDLEAEAESKNARGVVLTFNYPTTDPTAFFGRWVGADGACCVGNKLASALPGDGSEIRVRIGDKDAKLAVVGTVDASGPAATLGGSVLVMRLGDAAKLLGKPGLVTRIDLTLEPDADREQVKAAVKSVVGDADVLPAEANDKTVQSITGTLQLGFSLGGAGALVVGLFLVYNALAVSVAERRHDIGILRSLGATRNQIAGLFTGEAIVLGIIGAAIGVPLGLTLAQFSLGPVQKIMSDVFLPLDTVQLPIDPAIIITSVLAGIGVALLAALVPALQASQEEPADTVRRVPFRPGWVYRALQASLSGVFIVAGLLCMVFRNVITNQLGLSERTLSFGGLILVMIGGLLATPFLAAVVARMLGPVARRLFGIEGRLAADNLARSPGRTGLVIAALAAGVALLLQTAGLTLSSKKAVLEWVDKTMSGDLYVMANSEFGGVGESRPMNAEIGKILEDEIPEVEKVAAIRFELKKYGEHRIPIYVHAVDSKKYYDAEANRSKRPGRDLYPLLRHEGKVKVIVSDNFCTLHKVRVGDTIKLGDGGHTVELDVIGKVPYYSWNLGTIIIDRRHFQRLFPESDGKDGKEPAKADMVDRLDVYLRPGADPEKVRESILRRWGAEKSLVAMTSAEMNNTVENVLNRLYSMFYAQNVVIGLVAALGVVMALLISVLQRRRELGLLRAVGASRKQVLLSVLVEATLMGLIGALIGLLIGVPLEWYVVKILLMQETGFAFPVLIPWWDAFIVCTLALVCATLAGLGPALHAMRVRIAEAVAYE